MLQIISDALVYGAHPSSSSCVCITLDCTQLTSQWDCVCQFVFPIEFMHTHNVSNSLNIDYLANYLLLVYPLF